MNLHIDLSHYQVSLYNSIDGKIGMYVTEDIFDAFNKALDYNTMTVQYSDKRWSTVQCYDPHNTLIEEWTFIGLEEPQHRTF